MRCRCKKNVFKPVVFLLITLFVINVIMSPLGYAQTVTTVLDLPIPGQMVPLSKGYNPTIIRGLTIHPKDPLAFDFIVDKGDAGLQGDNFKAEANKLVKYFLTALTVPENELWVNLSPYEKDRIISESFGITGMGRDLLAQDYLLKQLSSSLIYPEKKLGEKFWDRVYSKAEKLYGTTDIPMNTFNKIWIVPEKAIIYEHGNSAYVLYNKLKVMLEEDYVALQKNMGSEKNGMQDLLNKDVKVVSGVTSDVVREVLIPEIEKEVNEGKTFANLRQIANSMVLATWYKQNLKESLLGKVYVDKKKIAGVDVEDKEIKEKIYKQYTESFKKGVFNYIKEDFDPVTQQIIPRKYFSGGMQFNYNPQNVASINSLDSLDNLFSRDPSLKEQIRTVVNRIDSRGQSDEEKTVLLSAELFELTGSPTSLDINDFRNKFFNKKTDSAMGAALSEKELLGINKFLSFYNASDKNTTTINQIFNIVESGIKPKDSRKAKSFEVNIEKLKKGYADIGILALARNLQEDIKKRGRDANDMARELNRYVTMYKAVKGITDSKTLSKYISPYGSVDFNILKLALEIQEQVKGIDRVKQELERFISINEYREELFGSIPYDKNNLEFNEKSNWIWVSKKYVKIQGTYALQILNVKGPFVRLRILKTGSNFVFDKNKLPLDSDIKVLDKEIIDFNKNEGNFAFPADIVSGLVSKENFKKFMKDVFEASGTRHDDMIYRNYFDKFVNDSLIHFESESSPTEDIKNVNKDIINQALDAVGFDQKRRQEAWRKLTRMGGFEMNSSKVDLAKSKYVKKLDARIEDYNTEVVDKDGWGILKNEEKEAYQQTTISYQSFRQKEDFYRFFLGMLIKSEKDAMQLLEDLAPARRDAAMAVNTYESLPKSLGLMTVDRDTFDKFESIIKKSPPRIMNDVFRDMEQDQVVRQVLRQQFGFLEGRHPSALYHDLPHSLQTGLMFYSFAKKQRLLPERAKFLLLVGLWHDLDGDRGKITQDKDGNIIKDGNIPARVPATTEIMDAALEKLKGEDTEELSQILQKEEKDASDFLITSLYSDRNLDEKHLETGAEKLREIQKKLLFMKAMTQRTEYPLTDESAEVKDRHTNDYYNYDPKKGPLRTPRGEYKKTVKKILELYGEQDTAFVMEQGYILSEFADKGGNYLLNDFTGVLNIATKLYRELRNKGDLPEFVQLMDFIGVNYDFFDKLFQEQTSEYDFQLAKSLGFSLNPEKFKKENIIPKELLDNFSIILDVFRYVKDEYQAIKGMDPKVKPRKMQNIMIKAKNQYIARTLEMRLLNQVYMTKVRGVINQLALLNKVRVYNNFGELDAQKTEIIKREQKGIFRISWRDGQDIKVVAFKDQKEFQGFIRELSPEDLDLFIDEALGDSFSNQTLLEKVSESLPPEKEQVVVSNEDQNNSYESINQAAGVRDPAMNVSEREGTFTKGGIDLDPAMLDLQIRRDDKGVPLPVWDQPLNDMNIEGFLPVIINVTPVNLKLPILSEFQGDKRAPKLASSV